MKSSVWLRLLLLAAVASTCVFFMRIHVSTSVYGSDGQLVARMQTLLGYYDPESQKEQLQPAREQISQHGIMRLLQRLMPFSRENLKPQHGSEAEEKVAVTMATTTGADRPAHSRPHAGAGEKCMSARAMLLMGRVDNMELLSMYNRHISGHKEVVENPWAIRGRPAVGGGRSRRGRLLMEFPGQENTDREDYLGGGGGGGGGGESNSVQREGNRPRGRPRNLQQGAFLDAGSLHINDTTLFLARRAVGLLPSVYDREHFFSGVWSIVAQEEDDGSISLYYIENKLMYDTTKSDEITFESSPIVATYNIRQAVFQPVQGSSSVATSQSLKTGQWMLSEPEGAAVPDITTSPVLNTAGTASFRRLAATGKGNSTVLLVPVWGTSTVAMINAADGTRSVLSSGLNSSVSVSFPRNATGGQKVFLTDLLPQPHVVSLPYPPGGPGAESGGSPVSVVGNIPKNTSGPAFAILGPYSTSADGAHLFMADVANNQILRMDVTAEGATTVVIAGSGERGVLDGIPAEAQFDGPWDVVLTADGCNLFVTDGNSVRYLPLNSPSGDAMSVKTVAQILPGDPILGGALGLALALNDSVLYIGRSDGQIHELAINRQALFDCVNHINNSVGALPTGPQQVDDGRQATPITVRPVGIPSTPPSTPPAVSANGNTSSNYSATSPSSPSSTPSPPPPPSRPSSSSPSSKPAPPPPPPPSASSTSSEQAPPPPPSSASSTSSKPTTPPPPPPPSSSAKSSAKAQAPASSASSTTSVSPVAAANPQG